MSLFGTAELVIRIVVPSRSDVGHSNVATVEDLSGLLAAVHGNEIVRTVRCGKRCAGGAALGTGDDDLFCGGGRGCHGCRLLHPLQLASSIT